MTPPSGILARTRLQHTTPSTPNLNIRRNALVQRKCGVHAKTLRVLRRLTLKRRKGKLELLPSMNLDILHQISCFLRPVNLLNLSRTTKSSRSSLGMRNSSAFLWREARRQIANFPDLSEPQYANLVFYPHCHGCGKGVKSVIWALRIRYYLTCLKNWMITWSEIHDSSPPCKDRNDCKWFATPAEDVKMSTRKTVLVCLRSQLRRSNVIFPARTRRKNNSSLTEVKH
ncbi:uncharacterized protein EDB91DRAFT_802349 [Suillus paluster]|uniref:uncharacterized protein n=1 Tax=Suillus paluster TaxID=48578 RepID=UPI001B880938|nr:uncharacterized protein EDB91DRAFT_802349 [Suillus paluster]KAG1729838.1 hypothetical protein EDB91DRAFT_802349 [Suillus paluster]